MTEMIVWERFCVNLERKFCRTYVNSAIVFAHFWTSSQFNSTAHRSDSAVVNFQRCRYRSSRLQWFISDNMPDCRAMRSDDQFHWGQLILSWEPQ